MNFQGSLETLVKTFIVYYLACAAIGQRDLAFKTVRDLRAKALTTTKAPWGCPSVFAGSNACTSYDPKRYKR